jgi:alkaline phosphatase D
VNNTATFKFVVTSVPFTSLWTGDAQSDSWAGYTAEKNAMLQVMHTVANVFLISGDRHEFAAVEFNGPSASDHTVHEISTSPLNQFYIPFIRTLLPQSKEVVKRIHKFSVPSDAKDQAPQFAEIEVEIPRERVLEYIAVGNHKWCAWIVWLAVKSSQRMSQVNL